METLWCHTKSRIEFYRNLWKMPPHKTTNVYYLSSIVVERDTSGTDLEKH